MIALTGTPGTGKTSIASALQNRGHAVFHASDTGKPYLLGADPDRDTDIIDDERWALDFTPVKGVIEGHLAHLLPAERIIILRCRPDILKIRLTERGYSKEKVQENIEAELLDAILIEAVEIHGPEKIYEIDTTDRDITCCTDRIEEVIRGTAVPAVGTVDWLAACGDLL